MVMIKISQKLKDMLWWLVISVDYDYSRITIADHDIADGSLKLWLEDKYDFKNSLDECLLVEIDLKEFAKVIKTENLNSYEGAKIHPKQNFIYKTRIEMNEPIKWYQEDASIVEQQWAREAVVKTIITEMVDGIVNTNVNLTL
jgi:hypothetical protein